MGAKAWVLFHFDNKPGDILATGAKPDERATKDWLTHLYPDSAVEGSGTVSLSDAYADGNEVYAACYSGVRIISCSEIAIDYPSKIRLALLDSHGYTNTVLVSLFSIVDWAAFAVWKKGQLERSISLSPDQGVSEDLGQKVDFEAPYWAGEHPAVDPDEDEEGYPFAFHPLELGEAALLHYIGYQIEGYPDQWVFDPEDVQLYRFNLVRRKHWWKFW